MTALIWIVLISQSTQPPPPPSAPPQQPPVYSWQSKPPTPANRSTPGASAKAPTISDPWEEPND